MMRVAIVFPILLTGCVTITDKGFGFSAKPKTAGNTQSAVNKHDVNKAVSSAIQATQTPQIKSSEPQSAKKVDKQSNQPANNPADSELPAVDISHRYKYKVRGKEYKVFTSGENFQEIGNASWYGPGFHGKLTANGERYDMHAMTAAHKTLPLGSWVQVSNLSNGLKVTVRINDRGPFHSGRIIDLSKKAAQQLGILKRGYGRVHIKIVEGK